MTENTYKKIYIIGVIGYCVLLFLSVLFYKERTFFVDIAFHIFSIITNKGLAIQNFRFGAVFTQLFPLLAVKIGFSLAGVAISYSMGFVLFYFACYIICGLVCKNYRIALVLLLFNTLFVSDTFYWIQSELPQGIAIMLVIFAVAARGKIEGLNLLRLNVIFAGLFMVAFTHPLIIFPFLYVVIFFLIGKEQVFDRKLLLTMLVFYLLMIGVKNVFFKTEYEKHAMGGAENLIKLFPHYFHLYSNRQFLHNCIRKFCWIPLASLWLIIVYTQKREYAKLSIFLFFILGYLLLINVSYPDNATSPFYIENMYLPLAVFIALPLIYDILPLYRSKMIPITLFAWILITGCIRIYATHALYSERVDWERKFIQANGDKKLLINSKEEPMNILVMTWGTPYEFWLLSTIETGKTASVIINDDPDQLTWALNDKKKFLTTWGSFDYTSLPSQYFIMKDTTTDYIFVR